MVLIVLMPLNPTFDQKPTAKVRISPWMLRDATCCDVCVCFPCRKFWSLSDDTNTYRICGISAICADTISNKGIFAVSSVLSALAIFCSGLIQTLLVRLVLCFGKNGLYLQLAESLTVKWVWHIHRFLNIKMPWDTVSLKNTPQPPVLGALGLKMIK